MHTLGNKSFLDIEKTAFLSSQTYSAAAVVNSYTWAKAQRQLGTCVVCGNHSVLEKDVFEILLRGSQPLILVLARSMYKRWPPEVLSALSENRLLIISPFEQSVTRISRRTAAHRNQTIINLSQNIVIGYKRTGGQLDTLLSSHQYEQLF